MPIRRRAANQREAVYCQMRFMYYWRIVIFGFPERDLLLRRF
jgi:hypothetical protein